MHNDIPILQKIYDFYCELYLTVEKMPKKDKYILGGKIQKITLDLMELIITASYAQRDNKVSFLNQAAVKLDLLKTLVRLTENLHAIPTKKYLLLEEKLQEIGDNINFGMLSVTRL